MQRRGQATNRLGGKRELLHPHPSTRLRIGINSGPVVAGIVGTHKFAYDLWGDAVNIASRMQSGGVPGSIQVSEATHELIRDNYLCKPRGVISVKGKGDMETYFLISRRSNHPVPS